LAGSSLERPWIEFHGQLLCSNYRFLVSVDVLTKQLNKNKDVQRDCLYYIAYAYFRLEDYQEARKYITLAIRVEPNNYQALALESLIKDRITKEGLLGVAIVGGVVAAFGAVALLTVKGLSRN
jgi:mitochondrial fission 1 protein